MLIRTRQSLVLGLSAAIALAIGVTLSLALAQIERWTDAVRRLNEQRDVLAELRFLTFEYLDARGERAQWQWHERLNALRAHVTTTAPVPAAEGLHLERARTALDRMESLFERITAGPGADRAAANGAAERLERLGSRLLAISQDLTSGIGAQVIAGREQIRAAQQRAAWLVVVLTAALLALMLANWVLLRKSLLDPVARLLSATETVAAGDLEHPIGIASRDEIGFLAAGFDRMTASLYEARVALEAELAERRRMEKELRRSNAELEQFAYVASHDLQEPLRMVVSYLQLLGRRYQGRLDAQADEFIAYAVDGGLRMRTLIEDLLAYSRVTTRGKPFETVDCAAALAAALANLKPVIDEAGAQIDCGALPLVPGERTQLAQLFQNLVGNSLKFCNGRTAHIRIAAERRGAVWRFSVADNGIGIEPQYHERIFGIFQRLHTRREFPGTGIGLAICKKIVERHGGAIGVESRPGEGATFHFTLPAQAEDIT